MIGIRNFIVALTLRINLKRLLTAKGVLFLVFGILFIIEIFQLSFVDQQIRIFCDGKFVLVPSIVVRFFSAKTLLLNVVAIEVANKAIIKLIPLLRLLKIKFLLLFNETIVMAAVSSSTVNYDAHKLEVVVV